MLKISVNAISGPEDFGIQSSMQGFDSRLLHNIQIISVKLGPVVRKTQVRWQTILSIASSGVAVETAFAI